MDSQAAPYDALLLVSFGGPRGADEVAPFLRRVTAGRGIPDERLAEVGAHYAHFDGISPINAQNEALIEALEQRLPERGHAIPVFWGNLYAEPFIADAVSQMQAAGVQRVAAFVTSMYSSGPGCRRYRVAVADAVAASGGYLRVDVMRRAFDHPGFVVPFVDGVVAALDGMPDGTRLAFTTHSLPLSAAAASGPPAAFEQGAYVAQHRAVASFIAHAAADRAGRDLPWDLVFQSRSGPPSQPWLEPDICDHLDELKAEGVPAVVVVPIGFVSNHVEVAWDLDVVAAEHAASLGLGFARVPTPGVDPRFVDLVVDLLDERIASDAGRPADAKALTKLGPWRDSCPSDCCLVPGRPSPT